MFGINDRPEIARVDLNIKFKDYKKILEDRSKSIEYYVRSDFREVNGELLFDDRRLKAKVRLKGDLSQHWRSIHRMSFRVKLKGDNSLLGFKEFSIHKPIARQHPFDQTFQDLQKKLSNISSVHNYVHLYVNGEDWGIMNIEEHVTKELLEKQNTRESLILN